MTKFKQLFSTPKKATVTILCMLAMVAVLGTGTVFAASAIAESSSIGAENAKNFAFADTGVDPVSASNVKAEFDYEHGQFVYEVEFIAGNSAYEYWIKASNGTVVKKQVEIVTQDGSSAVATAEITLDRAKEIALEDAGLAAADVTFTKEKLDLDDGISVYDVDFYADNGEYEYEINAVTGTVYSKSREVLMTTASTNPEGTSSTIASETPASSQTSQETTNNTQQNQNTQSGQQTQNPQTNQTNTADDTISVETAKEKALAVAGVSASAATFTKAKLDYDDGISVYDIEFYISGYEYDYEINAKTGAVRSKDIEAIGTASQPQNGGTASYIGIEKAKSIALTHAGVSDVTYTKAKMDRDDGQVVYEIEFRKDGMEYDYTIRATDGFILEYDSEWDD